jgi:hypothetical protein
MKISLIIFINCLTLIFLKSDELSIFKALVCANILTRKEPSEDNEVNSLSPILLTCFIKINDDQVRRLTEGIDKGFESILSEEEINDLIDIESLKDLSVTEVKKRGDELEEAIKELQKIQEGYSKNGEDDGYDDGYDDDGDDYDEYDDGPKNNISKKGFFRLIKKGIFNFGNIVLSSWYIICILVVFYLLLLEIRRNNNPDENKNEEDKEKKEDNNENKDDKKENEKEKEDKNKDENKEKDEKGEIKEKEKSENKQKEENKKEDNNLKEKID